MKLTKVNSEPLIVDGHLDLAMNAMEWNRDLRWKVEEIRASEEGMTDKPDRSRGTVSFPSMREGNIGLCLATLIARYVRPGNWLPGWNSPEQAWAHTRGQLAWYRAMEEAGEITQITDPAGLKQHLSSWETGTARKRIGYILSLEGADSIVNLQYLERAFDDGLRVIGPAHFGPGTYAHGTDSQGGLGNKGRELLKEAENLGLIIDSTHLSEESFWETLDLFKGPVLASHNNCRKFVNHNRQFSDEQIRELVSRGGVIGAAFDAWMLVPGWERGKSDPEKDKVNLKLVINNIDHVCQLSGNSLHAAIGSDLDGAFGREQSPYDLDTIADLQKVPEMLAQIGYDRKDIRNIMSDNWLRFLMDNLNYADKEHS
jgi:membrane dipeptidase